MKVYKASVGCVIMADEGVGCDLKDRCYLFKNREKYQGESLIISQRFPEVCHTTRSEDLRRRCPFYDSIRSREAEETGELENDSFGAGIVKPKDSEGQR